MRFARPVLVPSVLALSVLLSAPSTPAQTAAAPDAGRAGPVPEITLYTMGRGKVLWQKFGHAALCVEYPRNPRRSACYNYGTTDFADPVGVGWGFLRGQGKFWVSVTSPSQMIRIYRAFDRTIWKQVLPLTEEQVWKAVGRLEHDLLPENRYYTYHHFHDNCTTRLRDIIDEATDGALKPGTDSVPGPSYREFARVGFAEDAWLNVLTDLFLGRGSDARPNLWQAMFLPWYLRDHVEDRLGAKPVVVYQRQGHDFSLDPGSGGRWWLVLLALFLGAIVGLSRFKGRYERAALITATVPLGLLATLAYFLAIVTAVEEFRYNEVLLVFLPTDIALPFLGAARRQRYARVRVALLLLLAVLALVGVLTQPLWVLMLIALAPMIFLALPGSRMAAEKGAKATSSAGAGKKSPARTAPPARSKSRKGGKRKRKAARR